MRTISSAMTFFLKFILSTLWIGAFATLIVRHFLATYAMQEIVSGAPEKGWRFVGILSLLSIGGAFLYWFCIRLKKVSLDGDFLRVSNYVRDIRVPLLSIAEVRENRWVNGDPITIEFSTPTEFGHSVIFMPQGGGWGPWSSNPIADELRELVREAQSRLASSEERG